VPVLDLDLVGRRIVDRPEIKDALVATFGKAVLRPDRSIDRAELADICFTDAGNTARLNRIMHPLIWREAEDWIAARREPYVVIEASVLIESGGASRMDAVVVVLAAEETRRRRVEARSGFDRDRFRNVLARQCSDAERRRVADYVIENDGPLSRLRAQVERLYRRLEARFGNDPAAIDRRMWDSGGGP